MSGAHTHHRPDPSSWLPPISSQRNKSQKKPPIKRWRKYLLGIKPINICIPRKAGRANQIPRPMAHPLPRGSINRDSAPIGSPQNAAASLTAHRRASSVNQSAATHKRLRIPPQSPGSAALFPIQLRFGGERPYKSGVEVGGCP